MTNRLLLISSDNAVAQTVKAALESAAGLLQIDSLAGNDVKDKFQPQGIIIDSDGRGGVQATFDRIVAAKRQFPSVPVIAMGNEMSAQLVLAALRAGADDFVDRDVTSEELRGVIRTRLSKGTQLPAGNQSRIAAVLSGLPDNLDQDFALNLAVRAAVRAPKALTLYLDLSLPMTQAGIALNVDLKFSVQDAISEISRLDRALLEGALARCPKSGLYVMPLAADARRDDGGLDAADFSALIQVLQSVFGIIVVGCGPFSRQRALIDILHTQGSLFLCCNQRFSSVKGAAGLLQWLGEYKFANTHVAVHVTARDHTPSPSDIRKALGVSSSIDLDARWDDLAESLNEGAPLALNGAQAYVRAIDQCLEKMGIFPEPEQQDLKSTLLGWMRLADPKACVP